MSISAQTAINIRTWGNAIGLPNERIDEVIAASSDAGVAWTVDASPTADANLKVHLAPIFRSLGFHDSVVDRFIAKANELGPSTQLPNALATAPDVTGYVASNVEDVLERAGYTLGTVTSSPDQGDFPIGTIAAQSVAAAHEDVVGTAIDVTIQTGQTVPAAEDVLKATFLAALTSAGLAEGDETTANDETIAAGNIISCTPAEGSLVEYGTEVDYVTSLGAA